MENLTLFKQESFHGLECDLWKNKTNEIFMTSSQLSNVLGYVNKGSFKTLLSRNPYIKDEKEFSEVVSICTPLGGTQDTRVFTEDGVYEIAMLAKTETAKQFRKWIRNLLKGLRNKELTILQTKLLEQEGKLHNYNYLTNANNNLSMLQFAKGLRLGRNKLFSSLREDGILMSAKERKNIPYQPYIDRGIFHTILGTVINNGDVKDVVITTVTPKGIDFLVNYCKKKGLISATCEFNPNL